MNIERMRAAAECVINATTVGDGIEAVADYMTTANPAAVLELIVEMEKVIAERGAIFATSRFSEGNHD